MYLLTGYRFFCLALLFGVIFSCKESKSKIEMNINQTTSEIVELDSTIFTLSGIDFEVIFKQKTDNSSGNSKGAYVWQRSGPLYMILSDFYDKPIDFGNDPYSRNTYDLKITWGKGVALDTIREQVSKKLQNVLNYNIELDLRQEQVFQMEIINESLLVNNSDDIDLSKETISRRKIENNQWEFYGKLEGLAELITEKTGYKISGLESINYSEPYFFQLNAVGGFSGIKKQLEENHGIALNGETASIEYYLITFK